MSREAIAARVRAELAALHAECARDDPPSVSLLESYLERRFGADWREEAEAGQASDGGGERSSARGRRQSSTFMSREEALQILGVGEGAGADEIKEAYRRLMLKLHPDHGGSTSLAARVNQAKDVLLRRH